MGKCRLYLVRHGQSEGNLVRSFLGHTDLPLTELGHIQAEKTAQFLDDVNIDVLYASDLKRAYMTAEHIAEHQNLSIIADPVMREIYAGEWENVRFDDLQVNFAQDFKVWLEDIGSSRCTGGESFVELYNRIIPELKRIAEVNDGLNVCIATHATPIRCARLEAFGYGFEKAAQIGWTVNASVTVIDIIDGEFLLVEDNLYGHLGDSVTGLPRNV